MKLDALSLQASGKPPAAPPDSGHIQLKGTPDSAAVSAQAVIDNLEAVPPAIVPSSLVKVRAEEDF